jgi:hypothetical protein
MVQQESHVRLGSANGFLFPIQQSLFGHHPG